MDFGCVTPEYVYRMWEGSVAIEETANAMEEVGGGEGGNGSFFDKNRTQA